MVNTFNNKLKKYCLLAVIGYLILCVLAWIYYQERTVILDASFHLFSILKDQYFAIQVHRFGAFITQVLPLIGSLIDLSLSTLMKLYSFGFVGFNLLTFLFLAFVLREYKMALVLFFSDFVLTTHSFFWIQSELLQGLTYIYLFFGLVSYLKNKNYSFERPWWLMPLMGTLLLTIAFIHPLIVIPFLFVLTFSWIDGTISVEDSRRYGMMFLSFWLIKTILFKSPYDNTAFGGLTHFVERFPHYLSVPSLGDFGSYLIEDYYVLTIFYLGINVFYLLQMKKKKALLFNGFVIGYCLLIHISYPEGAEQFYLESFYRVLGLFVSIAVVFDVLLFCKIRVVVFGLILLFTLRIWEIQDTSTIYTARLDYIKSLVENAEELNQKMIYYNHELDQKTLMMTWGLSYEVWLYSTAFTDQSRSIVALDNPTSVQWAMSSKDVLITRWRVLDYEELAQPYFNLRDTTSHYVLMTMQRK